MSGTQQTNNELKAVHAFFETNPSIEFIRFQWIEYCGVLCTRIVTKSFCLSLADKKSAIDTACSILNAQSLDGSLNWDCIHIGVDKIWPDWSNLKVCHYQPRHAQVMCWVETGFLNGFQLCPRTRLQEITEAAKKQHDIEFLVGFEIEFYILDGAGPVDVAAHTFSTASLRNKCLPILEEIVDVLHQAGIAVRQFHSEGSQGLFEISTGPLAPLPAVDALVYSCETVKGICANHGLHATMFPKPFEKLGNCGLHFNVSMSPLGQEKSFLAGLLRSWPALAAFTMPNFDSYSRLHPGQAVCWSRDNKSAPIREIRDGFWELRTPDGTVNPYLALTAILTAGLQAVADKTTLGMKDPKKILFASLEAKEKTELGIVDMMPTTLREALDNLRADKGLSGALGSDLVDAYLKVKTKELEIFGKLTRSERMAISLSVF